MISHDNITWTARALAKVLLCALLPPLTALTAAVDPHS